MGELFDGRTLKGWTNQGGAYRRVTIVLNVKEVTQRKKSKPRPGGYIGLQKNSGRISFRTIRNILSQLSARGTG